MIFEGSEKKVELLLSPEHPGLRTGSIRWDEVVYEARASILSTVSNQQCDAYLLSESSLFVWDHRLLMITCGQTSLIQATLKLLSIIPKDQIRLLVYERKNELAPEFQPSDFDSDLFRLRTALDDLKCGEVITLGEEHDNHVYLFLYQRGEPALQQDMTVELLMHDLGASVRSAFAASAPARQNMPAQLGLHHILPNFTIDDYLFEPMGYSLNAISQNSYYTFHVTPEHNFSYASFETNHPFQQELDETIARVIEIFQPGSFTLVLFETHGASFSNPPNYLLQREVTLSIGLGYRVYFRNYNRTSPAIEMRN